MMELALDLGLKLGYCIRKSNGKYIYGTERLDNGGSKFTSFRRFLERVERLESIEKIYYENVSFGYNTYAVQSWGGLKSIMLSFADTRNIKVIHFEVTTIKKKFTGSGTASKMGMIHYAEKWIENQINDDNTADAIAVMYCGRNGVK